MNTLQTHFWAVRDYLAPVLRESKFKEHGRITPEEFVAAGDFLAYKFPTWAWAGASSSDQKYTRDFLPADKQYLISRGVPCLRRVSQMERAAMGRTTGGQAGGVDVSDERVLNFGEGHHGEEVSGKGGEDDWLATHVEDDGSSSTLAGNIADIPDSDAPTSSLSPGEEDDLAARVASTSIGADANRQSSEPAGNAQRGTEQHADIGDIPDMDDEDELGGLGEGVEEAEDLASAPSAAASAASAAARALHSSSPARASGGRNKLVSVRTYDCLITYDKYYQTPRMWLVGYDESGQPLKPAEIFEDVSSDYAQKTVTVEPFPHGNMSTASIHPCKHASVMKKVIERMNASVVEEQRKALLATRGGGASGGGNGTDAAKKKRGWGLGGAMKKVTGKESSGPDGALAPDDPNAADDGFNGDVEGLRVDQYLLIFLKFMASIVPAIEIDATQAM